MDVGNLLKLLKEHEVRFVIIGATAFPVHGWFGDVFVWFASLDDLIKMKQAAGRPKDVEDLKFLRRLKQKKPKG